MEVCCFQHGDDAVLGMMNRDENLPKKERFVPELGDTDPTNYFFSLLLPSWIATNNKPCPNLPKKMQSFSQHSVRSPSTKNRIPQSKLFVLDSLEKDLPVPVSVGSQGVDGTPWIHSGILGQTNIQMPSDDQRLGPGFFATFLPIPTGGLGYKRIGSDLTEWEPTFFFGVLISQNQCGC